MSLENLKHIFEEHGTETNTNSKAFFGSPIGGPVSQPYSGNPPNSNLINFNSNFDNFISPAATNILDELPTDTNQNAKAFFGSPIGGPIPQPYSGNPPNSNLLNFNTNSDTSQKAFFPEIPQPYSGNPPNSNLINFNSDNDNVPPVFATSPNPLFIFNEANLNNGVFTINGIEKTKFTSPSFPINYTPINNLNADGNFVNNDRLGKQGWPDLYNSNHTSININNPSPRSQNPFQPRGGGLDIKDSPRRLSFLSPSRTALAGSGTSEPYIVSNLPTDSGLSGGRIINAGGRNLPFIRALTDTLRIGAYLSSPAGLLNIAFKNADLVIRQTVVRDGDKLIKVPQRFNNGYNPVNTLLQVSPIARLIGHGPFIFNRSGFNKSSSYLSPIGALGDTPAYNLNATFTSGNPAGAGTELDGFFSGFGGAGGSVKKSTTGDKMTLAPMIKGKNLDSTGTNTTTGDETLTNLNIEAAKEGMPFYFKDLRDNTYIFFRAYLDGITESLSPSWAETNYIGRSEPVYVYERASREISFNLTLFAQTSGELNKIYEKMNKLTSLCYPQYAKDEFLSSTLSTDSTTVTKTRMKPPLMKLRLGDLYGRQKNTNGSDGGLIGFLGSLSYTIPDSATYETEKQKKVPKYIQAAITYKVIHNEAPNMDTQFYGYKGDS